MRSLFTNESLFLAAGQAVSGVATRTLTLRVMRGRAWITVEGISHDYWLSAGDTFTVTPGRLTVVEADKNDTRIDCVQSTQWLSTLKLSLRNVLARFTRGTVSASFKRDRACNESC